MDEFKSPPLSFAQRLKRMAVIASRIHNDNEFDKVFEIAGPAFDFSNPLVSTPVRGFYEKLPDPILFLALRACNARIAAEFIRRGINIKIKDEMGRTALFHAVDHSRSLKFEDGKEVRLVELLVERGLDVNAVDKTGGNPLFYALFHKNLEDAAYLIAKGGRVQFGSASVTLEWMCVHFVYTVDQWKRLTELIAVNLKRVSQK